MTVFCFVLAAAGVLYRTKERNQPMVTKSKPMPGKPVAPIYQLEIVLDYSKPRIWRRIQVPGSANLGWLHAVIQVAMGWTNSHLHQFEVGEHTYSAPAFGLDDEFMDGPKVRDEKRAILATVAPHEGDVLAYDYDFGDSWQHRVTVEKILPPDPAMAKTARCVDGARACPPEDCGGLPGYENLLVVLKNPKHREYESMLDWLGGRFDADAFDAARTDAFLRLLQWPAVTESQLAKVLMARDGHRG
jgi:hypothetical protein